MGEVPHTSSTAAIIHPHLTSGRTRTILGVLIAIAMAVSVLATVAAGPSRAADGDPDTIALVDVYGRFTILSDLSEDARTIKFAFGMLGDVPLMGDWNCDGVDTPGVYRLSSGGVYLRNSNSGGVADLTFLFGNPGDRAVAGDFNGDGCDTVSVYRSHRATAYLKNAIASGAADMAFLFGNPGDRSFSGDFDGDGVDTIGLRRNAAGRVYLSNNHETRTVPPIVFGIPGDQIIAGDWDGDGVDTIAAYRPASGMFYYRNSNSSGVGSGELFVGRGLTVVPVSGLDLHAIDGEQFDPDAKTPLAPVTPGSTPPASTSPGSTPPSPPTTSTLPPAPSPQPPSGSGESVVVPGFDPPPARQASGPIDISGESGVVIENLHISNPGGTCVTVTNASNVTIRNSTIGPCGDDAVYLSDVTNATVTGNYISDTANGVLVHRSNSIAINGNSFVNAGRNFVQFDKVNGPGSSISKNRGQNELGGSNAEDFISLFQSNGTVESPIRIAGNYLRSGGPSDSGSGIMLGDGGGGYQVVENNVLVNPGQVGIGVASGFDVTIRGNQIFSDSLSWSNVGLYVWNQYGSTCDDIEVSGNQVNWTAAGGYANAWWSGGGCSNVRMSGNDWDAPIGPGIFNR